MCKTKIVFIALNVLFVISPLGINALDVLDLNGYWQFYNKEYKLLNLKATVPGGIYTDLMQNGIIGDVFFQSNDTDTRWVAKTEWNYFRTFEIQEYMLSHDNVMLSFEGLDTFADIYLNNQLIKSTDNMFVTYEFDVKKYLKLGSNMIIVHFYSPVEKAKELFEKQSQQYVVPPKCVPREYNGECHANHVRKMQASFSWDWGPAFPSVGIWRPVSLKGYDITYIKNIIFKMYDHGDEWRFDITTYLAPNSDNIIQGTLEIELDANIEKISVITHVNRTGSVDNAVRTRFNVYKSYFDMWWPNGLGKQKLYNLLASFTSSNSKEVHTKSIKVGIRTIELVQDKIADGRTFYFRVNGVPFIAKGSNMIPSSVLPELTNDKAHLRFLLESAQAANMNMLRVWGGGLYESDDFYSIADELGIFIWQDFMFACAMVPTAPEFLASIRVEVEQQVRRLQYHPSIALWAGNNENEVALRQNWYGTGNNFSLYKSDYIKLYVNTVRKTVLLNDGTRDFLVSSPTNGIESEREGYVAEFPQDPKYGDIHYYNYIFNGWDSNIYQSPRMASEYGYQALPSITSLMTATDDSNDLRIGSDFMKHRQHLPLGFDYMVNLITEALPLPKENSANYHKAYIFYSQIYQAMAIKAETEHYRQVNSSALYWQLNDVWIAPTWSSIDFNNQWKMLHYYAVKFFAPVLISSRVNANRSIDVYAISDLENPIFNGTFTLILYKWDSFKPVSKNSFSVNISKGPKLIAEFQLDQIIKQFPQCGSVADCFFKIELRKDDGTLLSSNIILPTINIKGANMEKANVEISHVGRTDDNQLVVSLETDKIAAFVWLESDIAGTFSENGFFMVTPQMNVTFTPRASFKKYKRKFSVTHLHDATYWN